MLLFIRVPIVMTSPYSFRTVRQSVMWREIKEDILYQLLPSLCTFIPVNMHIHTCILPLHTHMLMKYLTYGFDTDAHKCVNIYSDLVFVNIHMHKAFRDLGCSSVAQCLLRGRSKEVDSERIRLTL